MKTQTRFSLLLALILCAAPSRAQDSQKETPPTEPVVQEPSVAASSDRSLRLNFRGVPLDMVLNYLSEAAGFIIVLETEPKGKVDVWSNQPLNKDEAVDLLNTILN